MEINFTVTKENLRENILELYGKLFQKVEKDELIIEEMNGGNVNTVCKVYRKNDKDNSVIFRTFDLKLNSGKNQKEENESSNGQDEQKKLGIDKLFTRTTEFNVMKKLSENGLSEKVFAKYTNGLCYAYTKGQLVNSKIMLTDQFLNDMSLKLAKFHSIKIEQPEIKFKTNFDRMKEEFGQIIDSVMDEVDSEIEKINELPYSIYPKLKHLKKEADEIEEKLKQVAFGEIVLAHNDLNSNNIIWKEKDDNTINQVGLIDFELVLNNYAALELSYLFTFFSGHLLHDFDQNLSPSKDYRLRFIRNYLKERNRINSLVVSDEEFEKQINLLFIRTNLGYLYFLNLFSTMLACFDFRKDIFNNPELDDLSKDKKYYLGQIGLKVYQFYEQIKDEYLKSADDYLNNNFTH